MSDRPPLRIAVLGLGRWGRTWVPVLRRHPDVVIAATAGGRRDGLGLGADVPHDRTAADALTRPDLDAVLVTLPVAQHLDALRAAAARGLHVLVEKPAVGTSAELVELRALAASTSSVVMVGQNYRERPWAVAAREQVAALGDLSHVHVDVARVELLDGGRSELLHPLLDDLAIHHLDLLRYLTGEEASVLTAISSRPHWSEYPGLSDVTGVLRLSGGAVVTYVGTWAARGRQTPYDGDWTFRGAHGQVEVRNLVVSRDGARVPSAAADDVPDADLSGVLGTFVAAVRDGGPVPTDVDDHARSLALTLSLREAAVR